MQNKKRILFCTESSHIKSGYGNYTRSIISRLHLTNKYEIAELSCYRTTGVEKDCPWKIYPNAVDKDDTRYNQYQTNLSNGFGQWRFDIVVADFKPDIVVDFRDIFMSTFERVSVFRDKFHWILAPTIDSFPIRQEWLDLLKNCDTLLTHTHWAKNIIQDSYHINVKGVVKDSIDTNIFRPKNKIACRNELDIPIDAFVIGSVMRNQKRKLIPNLLKIINSLIYQYNKKPYLYLHTSYPETIGWDIPDLLLEYGIYNNVLFTYVCKKCKYWKPMTWKGPQYICPKCHNKKMTLASVSNGIDESDLCKIYNTFDLYIQYAVCEGFGIPPLEAASCGVPFCAVDHGAMAELADELGGIKIPLATVFRDQENNSDRAYPNDSACTDIILKFQELNILEKQTISETQRSIVLNNHSWDITAQNFESILDNIETKNSSWLPLTRQHFANITKNISSDQNNRDFVYDIVDNILQEPKLKSSFFIQQVIMALDNGYILSDNNIIPYKQQDALKALEMWFNNKVMLNRFLEEPSIIKQDDFLNYS